MIVAAMFRRTQPLSIYTPRLLETSITVAMFLGVLETAPSARETTRKEREVGRALTP